MIIRLEQFARIWECNNCETTYSYDIEECEEC